MTLAGPAFSICCTSGFFRTGRGITLVSRPFFVFLSDFRVAQFRSRIQPVISSSVLGAKVSSIFVYSEMPPVSQV
jgi:hypothetical protein